MSKKTTLMLESEEAEGKIALRLNVGGMLNDQLRLVACFILDSCSKHDNISVSDCLKIITHYSKELDGNLYNDKGNKVGGNG